jgi:hypothetical protein
MPDLMAPTVLTVDAAGNVGANFTGKVHATGLDMDAALGNVTNVNSIRWLRQSDGAVVAHIDANVLGTQGAAGADFSGFLTMLATAIGNNTAAEVRMFASHALDSFGAELDIASAPGNPQGQRHTAIVSMDADSGLGQIANVLLDGGGNLSGLRCVSDVTLASTPTQVDIDLPTDVGGPAHALVIITPQTTSAGDQAMFLRLNGVSSATYRNQGGYFQGVTAAGRWDGGAAANQIQIGDVINASTNSNFGVILLLIPNYRDAVRYQPVLAIGSMLGLNFICGISSGLWQSAAAITQLNFTMGGLNFAVPSRFTTYVLGSRVN